MRVYERASKKLLKDKNYISYFLATAFSMGSSNILQFTLALYILEITGSPLVYASILSIIIIPRVMLTPISGVLGDRLKRINIMTTLNLFQVIIMLFYAVYSDICRDISLVSVYALVVLLEMIEVFYNTAESSILSEIIDKDLMEEAVTLSRVDDGIVFVTTPVAAAFVYNEFGIAGTFILISALLILTLILTFCIGTPHVAEIKKEKEKGFKGYVKEFKEGILEIKKDKFTKIFVFIAPLINFSFSAVFSVVITYVFLEILKISDYVYGIYRMATAGVSIVLPFLILPVIKKFKPLTLLKYSAISISAILFLIGGCVYFGTNGGNVFVTVCLITVLDCLIITSVMPLNIATQVFFQKNIKNEYKSRIMSVFSMLALSSIPLGNMLYGFLADILPAYACVFIAGLAVFISYPMIVYMSRGEEA